MTVAHYTEVMHDKLTIIHDVDDAALHQNSCVPMTQPVRDAAVLIPLVHHQQEWKVLYIRRAANERDKHSGQVAFPGGRLEEIDATYEAAALRETHEEIGVDARQIKLIGSIEPYITVTQYQVTPVVGMVTWPTPIKLQTSEVARAFLISLEWLRDRNNFTLRARPDHGANTPRRPPTIVFKPYDGEVLWGATARMTLNFIRALDENRIVLPASPA